MIAIRYAEPRMSLLISSRSSWHAPQSCFTNMCSSPTVIVIDNFRELQITRRWACLQARCRFYKYEAAIVFIAVICQFMLWLDRLVHIFLKMHSQTTHKILVCCFHVQAGNVLQRRHPSNPGAGYLQRARSPGSRFYPGIHAPFYITIS